TLFALQVKPKLADAPARPRDVLVLVDTSASKAQGPLALAQKITEELLGKLSAKDRVAIWTANTEAKDLSRGFKPPKDLDGALKALKAELPLGAVNLKKVLAKAADSFDERAGRQRLILFLGDGKSVAEPVDADERARLCAGMVKKEIAFFTVPLGARLDPHNLHGFATGTGGRVVRLSAMESVDKMLGRLLAAAGEPILYPSEFKLSAGVTEAFPTKLPPVRRDVGTLV